MSDESEEQLKAAAAAVRALVQPDAVRLEHPAHEQIVGYVDHALEATERDAIDAHLEICATCREDVADLQLVAVPATRGGRRVDTWWYLGAGLAAAAVLAVVMVRTNQRVAPAPSAPASVVASLKDGGRTVTLDAAGTIAGTPVLDGGDRDAVAAALRTSRVDVPASVAELRGRTGVLLGAPASTPPFGPASPLATAVVSTRPTFSWTALPRATSYVVSVFDGDLKKVADSGPLTTLEWTPASPFNRGVIYTWQVRARTAAGDVLAPRPPAPEARFRVLSQDETDRVAALRRTAADSPLVLGVLLARMGLIDDAMRELEKLAADNPSSAVARQLLASLHEPSPTTRNPAQ